MRGNGSRWMPESARSQLETRRRDEIPQDVSGGSLGDEKNWALQSHKPGFAFQLCHFRPVHPKQTAPLSPSVSSSVM